MSRRAKPAAKPAEVAAAAIDAKPAAEKPARKMRFAMRRRAACRTKLSVQLTKQKIHNNSADIVLYRLAMRRRMA